MNLWTIKFEMHLPDKNVPGFAFFAPGPVFSALGTILVCTLVVCGHSLQLLKIMMPNKRTVITFGFFMLRSHREMF